LCAAAPGVLVGETPAPEKVERIDAASGCLHVEHDHWPTREPILLSLGVGQSVLATLVHEGDDAIEIIDRGRTIRSARRIRKDRRSIRVAHRSRTLAGAIRRVDSDGSMCMGLRRSAMPKPKRQTARAALLIMPSMKKGWSSGGRELRA
jgi:hypothetical protein